MNLGRYEWIQDRVRDGHPKMVVEALKEVGTHETAGGADNPHIVAWAAEAGVSQQYRHDAEPWCGLFMAVVAKRAGYSAPALPLWAQNWIQFGKPSPKASFGDVLVFIRKNSRGITIGGHVGLYVAEDSVSYHVLGGNQSDQVGFARVERFRLRGVRRQPYHDVPATVTPIRVSIAGSLSTNEA